MEAIILAGGFGTRLQAIVPDVPKPMAPIAGRPFLEILLTSLAAKSFTRVILSLGYKANTIMRHFGDRFAGMDIVYVVEDQPLGTGGAVRLAMERATQGHVFVFNGDTYLDLEVIEVERRWQRNARPIIVARSVPDTARYGRLVVEGDKVTGFSEKGVCGSGLINAGCYVFARDELNMFKPGAAFLLENDYLAKQVGGGRFDVFVTKGHFIDIGVPEDYARAQTELAGV